MGRIKPRNIKTLGKKLIARYGSLFTLEYEHNKRILEKIAVFPGKNFRNKLAGYITRLKKREAKGQIVIASSET